MKKVVIKSLDFEKTTTFKSWRITFIPTIFIEHDDEEGLSISFEWLCWAFIYRYWKEK